MDKHYLKGLILITILTVTQHLQAKDLNISYSSSTHSLSTSFLKPMFARFHAFEVNKEQNTFLLNWETVEEISSQHYLVERSNDGRTFTPIATIPSKAADAASFYTYRDKAPLQGKNFYRIRQVDKNGGTSFSPIRSIEHTPPTQLQIVQRNHEIALYYNCEGKKSYTVFDIKGNLLKLGTMNNNKCVIAGLSPGLYIINLQTSTNTINTQVAVTN